MTSDPERVEHDPPRRTATGRQLIRASWGLLRADPELIWLPFIASVTAIVASAVLFVPGYALGWLIGGQSDNELAYWIGIAFGLFAATIVAVFFQAALVIGANDRAEGRDPTRSSVLAEAWKQRKRILTWSVFATTVGLVLRIIQDRLGAFGAILGVIGGLAWAVATFLVVPVLVAEDLGPIAALKRSSAVLRDTFGTSLRTTVRFGLIALALWIPVLAVLFLGVFILAGDSGASGMSIGVALILIAVVAMIVLGTVFSAVTAYAKALIYRYATGRPTPGVPAALLAGAFTTKKQRRGFA